MSGHVMAANGIGNISDAISVDAIGMFAQIDRTIDAKMSILNISCIYCRV